MDIYTVLLVDDEEEVIQVIEKKINWEGLGFSVIGHANNGVKALEMVEEYQPDVVMTDIKMPYMNGLELTARIRTEFPATKVLIFTGFDEFEYAKEAVHLEVEEYQEGELGILRSEIHKMTVRLREQQQTLQTDKVYLANSLADLSHQLRTPLTSMNLVVTA